MFTAWCHFSQGDTLTFIHDPNGPKHSKKQHHLDARNAMTNGITNGIKGPSWLMLLRGYSIVEMALL